MALGHGTLLSGGHPTAGHSGSVREGTEEGGHGRDTAWVTWSIWRQAGGRSHQAALRITLAQPSGSGCRDGADQCGWAGRRDVISRLT